jgi:Sulfatase
MERIGCGAGSHIVSTWTLRPRHASRYRELQHDTGKASPRIARVIRRRVGAFGLDGVRQLRAGAGAEAQYHRHLDDVGWSNIGAYNQGLMYPTTPHLDRLAGQGMRFTDYYAEPSCTAGRANFITGELPIRTGLTTVGQAGATVGIT